MKKLTEIISGSVCLSMALFGGYMTLSRVDSHESQLLRGASGYVRQYNGEKVHEPLDYALKTLEITREFQPEQIDVLEKEVSEIRKHLGEDCPPVVYSPVLENLGKNIENASKKRTKDWRYAVILTMGGIGMAIWSSLALREKPKQSTPGPLSQ